MSDKPDPAAVEAAVERLEGELSGPDAQGLWVEVLPGDIRTLLASHAALKAERDEALVEAYARATPIGAVPLPVKRGGQS